MKKVLCVKDYCGFKEGQIAMLEESLIGDKFRLYENESAYRLVGLGVHACFRDIETFEHNGEEWIKNPGEMIIPEGWVIDVLTNQSNVDFCEKATSAWDWRCATDGFGEKIAGFRVVATKDADHAEEKPAPKVEATWGYLTIAIPQFEGEIEGFNDAMKDRDERPLSPQELAFAAKHPEPEKPKPLAFPDVKLSDNFSCHVGGRWG